jgi:hypothetical protein
MDVVDVVAAEAEAAAAAEKLPLLGAGSSTSLLPLPLLLLLGSDILYNIMLSFLLIAVCYLQENDASTVLPGFDTNVSPMRLLFVGPKYALFSAYDRPVCTVVSSPIVATAVPVAFTAVLSTKYLQWSGEMSSNNKHYFVLKYFEVLDLWKRQCQIR